METDKTKPRIIALYLIFSFANPNAARDPIMSESIVVDDATTILFKIILMNGCPVKIDI